APAGAARSTRHAPRLVTREGPDDRCPRITAGPLRQGDARERAARARLEYLWPHPAKAQVELSAAMTPGGDLLPLRTSDNTVTTGNPSQTRSLVGTVEGALAVKPITSSSIGLPRCAGEWHWR